MTKNETMNSLANKLQNNVIFTNCKISINKAGNVHIQASNSGTRYTIGTFRDDENKFWIRGFNVADFKKWYTSPYRLNYNRKTGDYSFSSMEDAYNYFVNFWLTHKLNK